MSGPNAEGWLPGRVPDAPTRVEVARALGDHVADEPERPDRPGDVEPRRRVEPPR